MNSPAKYNISPLLRIIQKDDFCPGTPNHTNGGVRSRQYSRCFSFLDRLSAPACVKFLKNAGRVGLYRAYGDKQLFGDLPRAEPQGNELEHLKFTWGDSSLAEDILIGGKRRERLRTDERRVPDSVAQNSTCPDAYPGEKKCYGADIQLPRVIDDEQPVFHHAQRHCEQRKRNSVEQYGAKWFHER